jgi:methyltransferase-like protein
VTADDTMRPDSYDQFPYPSRSYPAAHVRKLEAVATLFGMHPQPVSNCRVLELGCATAWNLIPQSMDFPQSTFVGIEPSERQVTQGQSIIATLGLDNIELRQADLLDVDASWGQFDYILCHGVYSWVPEYVREKILGICKKALSPNGVALISYNVLPGWHFRGAIRDLMLFHTSRFDQPEERISQARAVLGFMTENCSADTAYGQMLREELDFVRNADDQYFYHEHLEMHNHATYFHQFVERAEAEGLQYLADTTVATMFLKSLVPEAKNALANVEQEQYMDFLRNRKFRSTLLCHQGVPLVRNIGPAALRNFHHFLTMRPEPFQASFDSKEPLSVRFDQGTISTSAPLAMAVVEHLSNQWPRSITIDELHTASVQRLATSGNYGESLDDLSVDDIAGTLMYIFAAGALDFYVHPPTIANLVSSRPLATPLARLQASSSGSTVTNQRHENVKLDEFSRYLLILLDSQHDLALLSDKVQTAIAKGELTMPQDRQHVQRVDQPNMDDLVSNALTALCHASLLIA